MNTPVDKQKVLADVGALVRSGDVTLKELENAYTHNLPEGVKSEKPTSERRGGIATALYVVGTVIVCAGICALIGQNWDQLNTVLRIGFTLGLGVAVLAVALYRARGQADVNRDLLATSLLTIAGVAISIGAAVCVAEAGLNMDSEAAVTGVSLVLLGCFTTLYLRFVRSLVLLYMAIISSVALYFAAIAWALHDITTPGYFDSLETALVGILVIAGGIALRSRAIASRISETLYGIGSIVALGGCFWATFALNFFGESTSTLLADLLYPLALAAGVWLSVFVRSRGVLIVTAFFLTCYIFKISATYFSAFLGGSFALLLAGALVIGMAYGTTRFAKRYIAK